MSGLVLVTRGIVETRVYAFPADRAGIVDYMWWK
jgi:hypothetical protein